ncbi:MAG: hypothetical protein SWQ30_02540 [Thermodesulfobacteriota bacterium]|nr:hypothetical protein [Thermodesulfobacteriota bacterium]
MLLKTKTFGMIGIAVMAFGAIALGVSLSSSWAQDLGGSGNTAVGANASPLLQYGMAVSGNDVRTSAEMIAVRQEGNSNGLITTTRYHERVSASGDIDKFNVSFHYESMPMVPDTSERVQSILDSSSLFGVSPLLDGGFLTEPNSETPLPWYAQ